MELITWQVSSHRVQQVFRRNESMGKRHLLGLHAFGKGYDHIAACTW